MVGHVEIGVRYFGKTDAIGNEAVYTAILVVGIPLIPLGSWYGVRSGNRSEHVSARRIRLHLKSLLLAYLRMLLVIPPIVAAICASPNPHRPDWSLPLLALAAGLALLYLLVLKGFVKAPRLQKQQRLLLAKIVNTTVDPDWLRTPDARETFEKLRPTLEALHLPIDSRHWQLQTPHADLAPFIYAMARYMRPLDPAADWQIVADRTWSQIATEESAAIPPASSPRAAAQAPLLLAKNARS